MMATGAWIDARVTVPDLLQAAPAARPILDRYGLRCSGPGRLASLRAFAQGAGGAIAAAAGGAAATACDRGAQADNATENNPGCLHCAGRLHW